MKTRTAEQLISTLKWTLIVLLLQGISACESATKNLILPAQIITGQVSAIMFNSAKCEAAIDDTKAPLTPRKTNQTFTSTSQRPESL